MRNSLYLHEPVGNLRLWASEKDRFASPGRILLQARIRSACNNGYKCGGSRGSCAKATGITRASRQPRSGQTTQLKELKTEDSPLCQGYGAPSRTEGGGPIAQSSAVGDRYSVIGHPAHSIALLTGGADKPYVLGLAEALTLAGVAIDVIGSDDLTVPELLDNPRVGFLNLRGDQSSAAGLARTIKRIVTYYWGLT